MHRLPAALDIVNPKLAGSAYPFPSLAGVGQALNLVQGLSQRMGLPWGERLLQLAALGTVTDVIPLVGYNRYIVAAGLRSMTADPKAGLKEPLRLGGLALPRKEGLSTDSISFVLRPRLNATGWLGHAISSYNLLRASSQQEAIPLAQEPERLNRERQELTRKALDDVNQQMGAGLLSNQLLLLWSEEFTPGIVGLLARRLVDERYPPAIVVALDGDVGRGSARSIPEFNMASTLKECGDLFTRFGGHPRAAGFIISRENLPALQARFLAIARQELAHLSPRPTIRIDAHVSLTSLTRNNFQFFHDLAPCGDGNPAPVFITKGVEVMDAMRLGAQGQHLKLRLKHGGALWDAMAFGQAEAWHAMPRKDGHRDTGLLDVVYSLGIDQRRGPGTVRLIIEDFRPAEGSSRA